MRGAAVVLGLCSAFACVVSPAVALAEAVECPSCWRMIDDGPCRCPHCGTALPGRTCPPATEQAPAREVVQEPTKARQGGEREQPRPPAKRRVVREEGSGSERPQPRSEGHAEAPRRASEGRRGFDGPVEERPPQRRESEQERDEDLDIVVDEVDDVDVEVDDEEADEPARGGRASRGGVDEEDEDERRPLVPYRHGPAFLVGYRYFGLYDWTGEGHAHAFNIEGYPFRRYVPWLRAGLGLDVGFRQLESHTDWTMRGYVELGVQYPRRVTPYGSVTIGGGTVYQKRFAQSMTDGMFAVGFDVGATFGLSRTFSADLSVGYLFFLFNDLGFHSPSVRVSLGW